MFSVATGSISKSSAYIPFDALFLQRVANKQGREQQKGVYATLNPLPQKPAVRSDPASLAAPAKWDDGICLHPSMLPRRFCICAHSLPGENCDDCFRSVCDLPRQSSGIADMPRIHYLIRWSENWSQLGWTQGAILPHAYCCAMRDRSKSERTGSGKKSRISSL